MQHPGATEGRALDEILFSFPLICLVDHPFANALPAEFPAPATYAGQSFNYYIVVE